MLSLLEACLETRGALARIGHADRRVALEPGMQFPQLLHQAGRAIRWDAKKTADGIVAAVEERPRRSSCQRLLERVVGAGSNDQVTLVEVAAQPRGTSFQIAKDAASGELLEKVLDQVLLGQPLNQLDLLERESRLVRSRAREVDLRGSFGPQQSEQFVVGDERNSDCCGSLAPSKLWSKALELDRRPGLRSAGCRRAQPQLLGSRLEQIHVADLGVEKLEALGSHRREEFVDALGACQDLGQVSQVLELSNALPGLFV